jgi:hypothetical protein
LQSRVWSLEQSSPEAKIPPLTLPWQKWQGKCNNPSHPFEFLSQLDTSRTKDSRLTTSFTVMTFHDWLSSNLDNPPTFERVHFPAWFWFISWFE